MNILQVPSIQPQVAACLGLKQSMTSWLDLDGFVQTSKSNTAKFRSHHVKWLPSFQGDNFTDELRFEKSLYDLIRGLRNHRGNEREYIQNSLRECRLEIRGADMGMRLLGKSGS